MNTNTLAKHYGHLTPRERIPLLLAAWARDDALKEQRLSDSAPTELFDMPDYGLPFMALSTLSLMYITEQLDHLAVYWHAVWRLTTEEDNPSDWKMLADASAYVFRCNAEAWRRFCGGLNIDPGVLAASNYRGWMLQYAESCMPNVAPSREDACATLRACGFEDPKPVTADDRLASWRRFFDFFTGQSSRTDCAEEGRR